MITLGEEFTADFIHGISLMTLDIDADGVAFWGGGNWPEGTSGSVSLTTSVFLQLQTTDGIVTNPNNSVFSTSDSFPYECDAEEGCPIGDPALGSGSVGGVRNEVQVSDGGEEVGQAFSVTEVSLTNPAHGSGQVTVTGDILITQTYRVKTGKDFAEFLSNTSDEFGSRLAVLSLASSDNPVADIALDAAEAAAQRLFTGDPCATGAISAAAKELIAKSIPSPAGPSKPGSSFMGSIGLAATVTNIVASCLAADPPDFDVTTTIDPAELFDGIEVPPVINSPVGEALSAAAERDIKIALVMSAVLDAFERFQGAEILEDVEAQALQLDNYEELMNIARELAKESAQFYESEISGLLSDPALEIDFDLERALSAIESIDDDLIRSVLEEQTASSATTVQSVVTQVDESQVAAVRATLDQWLSVANTPELFAQPFEAIETLDTLYTIVDDYTTTDLQAVLNEKIGRQFWETPEKPDISISQIPGPQESGVELSFEATPGTRVEIQTSADLENWNQLSVETIQSDPLKIVDQEALDADNRFYRAREIEDSQP